MSNLIAGVAYLKVDGKQYQLRGNFMVKIGPVERTGIAGQDGVHGFSEAPIVPYISGDISDRGNLSLEALQKIEDVTVMAELKNGKSYVLRNAWFAESPELNATEGSLPVKFEGMKCEEII